MHNVTIFLFGFAVVAGFGLYALIIGVIEASDPAAAVPLQNLPGWERRLVRLRRKRATSRLQS